MTSTAEIVPQEKEKSKSGLRNSTLVRVLKVYGRKVIDLIYYCRNWYLSNHPDR